MSNRNRQIQIFNRLEPAYEQVSSVAREDAMNEQQRARVQKRRAVQALQNEYDAIFRGVTHR